jgi:ribosome-associated translation inhibitor RaiA
MELQIESRNIDMTPEWKPEIEERMTKLQSFYDKVQVQG